MKEFFGNIMGQGTAFVSNDRELRYVKLTNTFALVMTIVSFSYVPIFFLAGFPLLGLIAIILGPLYYSSVFLNSAGLLVAARIWIKLILDMAIFIYAMITGPQAYIHLGFIMTLVIPFLMFPTHQLKTSLLLALCSPLGLAVYLVIQVANSGLDGFFVLRMAVTITVCSITAVTLYFLSKDNETYQHQLSSAIEVKRNLLSMLSHDILNPLSVAVGNTRLLKKKLLQENLNALVPMVEKSFQSLQSIGSLIENVRTLQSMEQNKFRLNHSQVSIQDLFQQVEDLFQHRAKTKGISLVFNNPVIGSLNLPADQNTMAVTLLGNLVSNAIKFSFRQSKIEISSQRVNSNLILKVKDYGRGIEQDRLRTIFDSEGQTSTSGTLGERGTGLGLPLLHAVTQMMAGKVSVHSKLEGIDRGTEFTIEIPIVSESVVEPSKEVANHD